MQSNKCNFVPDTSRPCRFLSNVLRHTLREFRSESPGCASRRVPTSILVLGQLRVICRQACVCVPRLRVPLRALPHHLAAPFGSSDVRSRGVGLLGMRACRVAPSSSRGCAPRSSASAPRTAVMRSVASQRTATRSVLSAPSAFLHTSPVVRSGHKPYVVRPIPRIPYLLRACDISSAF